MKPMASLSLDLDDQWAYRKARGDSQWAELPTYLDRLVPRVRLFLGERGLDCTVFVVGQDAALDRNRELLQALADDGYELGNHSFHHGLDFQLGSPEEVDREIASAEEQIERVTGQRPRGFRSPAFGLSRQILEVLARRGYEYDASSHPTYLGPVARMLYAAALRRPQATAELPRPVYGPLAAGTRPAGPHRWKLAHTTLVEIPVTTWPMLKLPLHMSYLHALGVHSQTLALQYFRLGLELCRRAGTEPSFLLHPTDFLGAEDTSALSFFPGMRLRSAQKLRLVGEVLDLLTTHFEIRTVGAHARHAAASPALPVVRPDVLRGFARGFGGRP